MLSGAKLVFPWGWGGLGSVPLEQLSGSALAGRRKLAAEEERHQQVVGRPEAAGGQALPVEQLRRQPEARAGLLDRVPVDRLLMIELQNEPREGRK